MRRFLLALAILLSGTLPLGRAPASAFTNLDEHVHHATPGSAPEQAASRSAPGDPDREFGVDGRVVTDFGHSEDFFQALAIQPDGKTVAVGRVLNSYPEGGGLGLVRYQVDGPLDPSFGGEGKVIAGFLASGEPAALAIQPDGKIVVAGYAYRPHSEGTSSRHDFVLSRFNPDGTLDSAFDGDGWLYTDFAGDHDQPFALALQPDGKIVVAGYAYMSGRDSGRQDFAVVRYNGDGSLDPTFDLDGRVTTDFNGRSDQARAVGLQSDGKIVVVGSSGDSNADIALARYSSTGGLDLSFGALGRMTLDLAGRDDQAYHLVVQPDDRLVIQGHTTAADGQQHVTLIRYNADGTLDHTFDGDGILRDGRGRGFDLALQEDGKLVSLRGILGSSFTRGLVRYNADGGRDTTFGNDGVIPIDAVGDLVYTAADVAIQSDGKFVVGSSRTGATETALSVARYNPDDRLDLTFDERDGAVTTYVTDWSAAHALAVQRDGKLLVGGSARSSITPHDRDGFLLLRYNPDGSLDPTFGDAGRVGPDHSDGDEGIRALALQRDGKIVVAGSVIGAHQHANQYFLLARYHPDGSLDTSFGGGKVTTDFGPSWEEARGLALQPDGKIVVAGSADGNFAVARYNTDGSLDATFGSGGSVTTDLGGDDRAWALDRQADGKLVVAGTSGAAGALARYNVDGSLDTSFDGDGKVIGPAYAALYALAVQTDGKLLAAGKSESQGLLLVRFNLDGSLDPSFGAGGKVVTSFARYYGIARALILQPDGRILVAGQAPREVEPDVSVLHALLARYHRDGSLDTSFGWDGVALSAETSSPAEALAIALQQDGRIVVAGTYGYYSAADVLLARYLNPPARIVDDTALGIRYNGWSGALQEAASGAGYRVAAQPGETVTFQTPIRTTAITFVTSRGPNQGTAQVVINGRDMGSIDLYAPQPEPRHTIVFDGLRERRHAIVVKVLRQKNPDSSGRQVRVDAFAVGSRTVEESSRAVGYGGWNGRSARMATNGGFRISGTAGDAAVFTVVGSHFTWLTAHGPAYGQAEVSVDGVAVRQVDLYSAVQQWQAPVQIGGLGEGRHRVRIKVLGTRHPDSSGQGVVFDGFSVP